MLDENGMINTADDLSLKALEKVHKKLRRKFHPDKNIGNEDIATKKFHRVDEAWHQIIKALGGKN
jgi:DnaJ-class molecular chaperone